MQKRLANPASCTENTKSLINQSCASHDFRMNTNIVLKAIKQNYNGKNKWYQEVNWTGIKRQIMLITPMYAYGEKWHVQYSEMA